MIMDTNKSGNIFRLTAFRLTAISILTLFVLSFLTCKTSPPKRNVLLVTIDTLRADRLGCYGSRLVKTPNIDAFAQKGVLFEETTAPVPLTLPSHASILTGAYPIEHGIHDNGFYKLPKGYTTLAGVLAGKGYQTAAFVASGTLNAIFGLDQGFQHYDDLSTRKTRTSLTDRSQRPGNEISDKVIAWLQNKHAPKKPFFIWAHYFDPHSPYSPPSPFKEDYKGRPYDGEVAFTDQEIGRLLKTLEKMNLDKNTLIVITADHGESLYEHGESSHGIFLYRATMRVPLVFSGPGVPTGKRINTLVRLIDIFPTVLTYLGLEGPPTNSARDLLPMILGKVIPSEEPAYIETEMAANIMGWSPLRGLRTDRYKYIAEPANELYDIQNDPAESDNLLKKRPETAAEMRKRFKQVEALLLRNKPASSAGIFPDKAMRKRLESLGYVGEKLGKRKVAKNPADMIEVLMLYEKANKLSKTKDWPGAIWIAEKGLALDPDNPRLLHTMAFAQHQKGELEESIKTYDKLLKLDPRLIAAWSDTAIVYYKMKRYDKTAEHARMAIQLDPNTPKAHYMLGAVLELRGKKSEAIAEYRTTLELDPIYYNALNQLGNLLLADPATADEGRNLLEKARTVNNGSKH